MNWFFPLYNCYTNFENSFARSLHNITELKLLISILWNLNIFSSIDFLSWQERGTWRFMVQLETFVDVFPKVGKLVLSIVE